MKLRTVKRKVVELDAIDVNSGQLQEVEINGHYGVFTELRVDKSTIPEGMNCYELRHGEDDSYPAAMEQSVRVNYFGAVLMTDKMELGEDGSVELTFDDFGFTGEDLSMLEYRANYLEEPECFSGAEELVKFVGACDTPFELTETEADKLLGYMSGHDFLLGEKDGKPIYKVNCHEIVGDRAKSSTSQIIFYPNNYTRCADKMNKLISECSDTNNVRLRINATRVGSNSDTEQFVFHNFAA